MELPRFDNYNKFIPSCSSITITATPYEQYCLEHFGKLDNPRYIYFDENRFWESAR